MPKLTFDLPQQAINDLLEAAVAIGGYRPQVPDTSGPPPNRLGQGPMKPNPEPPDEFALRWLRDQLLGIRRQHRVQRAMRRARDQEEAALAADE